MPLYGAMEYADLVNNVQNRTLFSIMLAEFSNWYQSRISGQLISIKMS